jgi:hypothetical protein
MGRVFRFAQGAFLCVGTLLLMTGTMCAQDALPIPAPAAPHFGIPEDWSTQHVIYTRNGSVEDMLKVRNDPRFLNNILLHYIRERRNQTQAAAGTGLNEAGLSESGFNAVTEVLHTQGSGKLGDLQPAAGPTTVNSKVDWAVSLGGTGGMAVGESPAKYTLNPGLPPSCSDFVVYTDTAAPKAGTQANLVGLTNLYSGTPTGLCGTAPTFLFSYAIGASGSALSPTLSLNGTQVAWLGNANPVVLHVTTWATGTGQGTNATTGSVAPNGTFSTSGTCSPAGSSCDVTLSYTTAAGCTASSAADSDSDLYVDYASNSGYVSADNGILYRISNIFSGTPAIDYCITVNAGIGAYMSGPVYDEVLNEVFVTDSSKIYAYTVGASSFTLAASYTYAANKKGFAASAPLLDAFNGWVYVFSTDDKNGDTSVAQLPTSLASAVFVPLGPVGTNPNVYLNYGAFDNNYYTYGPAYGTHPASTLYSCGTDATTTAQDLFAIGFNASSGLALTTPAMAANKNVNPGTKTGICSPITEFYDGTTDRIFVGVGDYAGATTGADVVQMWTVTTQLTSTSDTPTASAAGYQGGTTGFAIDNNAIGVAQAESIYFSTLATSGTAATCGANLYCAVKLTQSGLK